MQYTGKWIADDAISGSKFRLNSGEHLRIRNFAGTADLNVLKARPDDVVELQTLLEVNPALPMPNLPKHLATVEWVENTVKGKGDAKDAVNVLVDTNIDLTGVAPLVIDDITVLDNFRLSLTAQTDGTENGFYVATIVGLTYSLARAGDANTDAAVTTGMWTQVISGTVYGGWTVQLTTPDPIVLDTTPLTFVTYPSSSAITAGEGIKRVGNNFEIDLATNGGLESDNAGNPEGKIKVKTDQAALEKDKTTRLDPSTGAVSVKRAKKLDVTLSAGDITNGYVDLPHVAGDKTVELFVVGGGYQREGDDYSVNYTGGTGSKTRVTLEGGLADGGVSELVAGEQITITYEAF